jgi:UDP-2,3-diacylglucosamine pyrophosphatase LpxH
MASWRRWRARVRAETRAALDRLKRPIGAEPPPPTAHLLAISDLHLGHDLKRGHPFSPGEVPATDRHLGAFLDHYRTHREGRLPWRLVMVGDVVDFIAVTITPESGEAVPFQASPDEQLYGLGTEPEKARWKLDRVIDHHRHFFAKLAQFLAAGNELVIVRGNHDQEWMWPDVQTQFRRRLAALAGLSEGALPVRFCDWFYLEPGRFYAEHGHFYDEFSVSGDMIPVPGVRAIREPVSTLAQRYFANKHTTLDLSDVERWGIMDFIRWGRHGGRFVATLGDYLAMCGRVLAFSARASVVTMRKSLTSLARSSRKALEEDNLVRVREALRGVRLDSEDLARSLVALTRRPADQSVFATAQMLYFDRILLGAITGLAAASSLLLSAPIMSRIGIALGVVLAATLLNGWLSRARLIDSHPKLIAAAERVSTLFRVPVVVMGHSHKVVDQGVGQASQYYNLGTWVTSSSGALKHEGFPHVVIGATGHQLRRWPLPNATNLDEVAQAS